MKPTNNNPLLAGAQLKHETPLINVTNVLWLDGTLYCSCDEVTLSVICLLVFQRKAINHENVDL